MVENFIFYNSPAKINLFLKIVGKINDEFHDLESVFAYLNLYDQIKLSCGIETVDKPLIKLEISGDTNNIINPQDNIFTKIFNFFVSEFKIDRNINIELIKNIPIGAGLGGGSSNGACLMNFINDQFNLTLSKSKLQEISFKFGSDLAFFFEDKASIVRKRGFVSCNINKFEPIDVLLINPNIHISTKEIFDNFQQNYSNLIPDITILKQNPIDLIKDCPNQLQEITQLIEPKIAELLLFLKSQRPIAAKMTGSGSTCFAIFDNKDMFDQSFQNCLAKFPRYYIKKAKIIHSNEK